MGRYIRMVDVFREENAGGNDRAVYNSYEESDGEFVVGELVDVRLPTGDWVMGSISEIQRYPGFESNHLYISVQVIKGNKMWGIEVRSPRDIRIRHRMRPFSAWRKY